MLSHMLLCDCAPLFTLTSDPWSHLKSAEKEHSQQSEENVDVLNSDDFGEDQ